jgi:hypothetical protein
MKRALLDRHCLRTPLSSVHLEFPAQVSMQFLLRLSSCQRLFPVRHAAKSVRVCGSVGG